MKKILIAINYFLLTTGVYAQVGIGIKNPNPNSELDIASTDKGVLLPRIKLKTINSFNPLLTKPTNSLLVYNITVNGTLEEGFYYWFDSRWNLLIDSKHVNNLTADNNSIKIENKIISAEADKAIWNAGSIKGVDIEVGNLADGDMLKYKGDKWTAAAETVVTSNSFLSGTENPSEKLGKEGDFYLNLKDGELYYNKGKDKWEPKGSFKGTDGKQGADGILSLTNGVGINIVDEGGKKNISAKVDKAIWDVNKLKGKDIEVSHLADGDILKYKGGKWTAAAETVATFNTFLIGEGKPSDKTGRNGDVYLDESNSYLYKKESGTWGEPKKSLKGDQGSRGNSGNDASRGWLLDGNNSTEDNFLGTKNVEPLVFKTNYSTRMRITKDGKIGINTTDPSTQLHTKTVARYN